MKNRKVCIMVIAVLVLCLGFIYAEGQKEAVEGAAAEETMLCRYVVPGNEPLDASRVVELINKKLQNDGVNVEFKPQWIPWDAWQQKVNLMLSMGEEFEMIHCMENGYPNTSGLIGKDALLPLNDYIDEYGTALKARVSEAAWTQATTNGKIYSLPTTWIELANTKAWISYRKDVLDKLGLEEPKNLEDLITVGKPLQKEMEEIYGKALYSSIHSLGSTMYYFQRTFDTYPFSVKQNEQLAVIYQDGTVGSWLETEEFEKQCKFVRRLYSEGLLNPDILMYRPGMPGTQDTNNGEMVWHFSRSFGQIPEIKRNVPEAEIAHFRLNPEVPNLRFFAFVNCNAVPVSAEYPEAAVKFVNWLYSAQENHDLLMFGEEGVHWKAVGDRYYEVTDKFSDYGFATWQIGLIDYVRLDAGASDQSLKYEYTVDEEAENFIAMGFNFNSEPVKVEFANCIAEFENSIYPIKWGVVDYDEEFPAALRRMKAAGLDEVIAEYKRQFEAWLKTKE